MEIHGVVARLSGGITQEGEPVEESAVARSRTGGVAPGVVPCRRRKFVHTNAKGRLSAPSRRRTDRSTESVSKRRMWWSKASWNRNTLCFRPKWQGTDRCGETRRWFVSNHCQSDAVRPRRWSTRPIFSSRGILSSPYRGEKDDRGRTRFVGDEFSSRKVQNVPGCLLFLGHHVLAGRCLR